MLKTSNVSVARFDGERPVSRGAICFSIHHPDTKPGPALPALPAAGTKLPSNLKLPQGRPVDLILVGTLGPRIFVRDPLQGLIHKTPEPDIVHEPQQQKHGKRIRAACTHQRQWDPGYRHTADHHPHVHQNVKQQHSRYPHANIHPGAVRCCLRVLHYLHQQQEIQT